MCDLDWKKKNLLSLMLFLDIRNLFMLYVGCFDIV